MSSSKGNKVKLKTFLSWQKVNLLGYKTEVKEGVTYVNYVWCKVCACHEHVVKSDKSCKWEVGVSMLQFVRGTNNITKHSVLRHFTSNAYKIAVEHESTKSQEQHITLDRYIFFYFKLLRMFSLRHLFCIIIWTWIFNLNMSPQFFFRICLNDFFHWKEYS